MCMLRQNATLNNMQRALTTEGGTEGGAKQKARHHTSHTNSSPPSHASYASITEHSNIRGPSLQPAPCYGPVWLMQGGSV